MLLRRAQHRLKVSIKLGEVHYHRGAGDITAQALQLAPFIGPDGNAGV